MIPTVAVIQVENPHWRGFRFWVPLIMLWLPLLILSPALPAGAAGGVSAWAHQSVARDHHVLGDPVEPSRNPRPRSFAREPGAGEDLVKSRE